MTEIRVARVPNVRSAATLIAMSAALTAACGAGGNAEADAQPGEAGTAWEAEDFVADAPAANTAATNTRSASGAYEPESLQDEGGLAARSNSVLSFRWTKGDPVKVLAPYSTHICGLAMVRGEMKSSTSVMVLKQGPNWVLRGLNAGSNLLQMDAVCEPLSAFRAHSGSPTITGDYVASTINKNVTITTNMPARTAPIFTGVVGKLEGGGERARIGFTPFVQIKNGGQDGVHSAFASALSFGLPAGASLRFNSYFSDGFATSDGRDFGWLPSTVIVGCTGSCCGYQCPTAVAPLATAFCYLSSVSGDFNGADEWVQLVPNRTRGEWTVAAEAESGNGVNARVSCIAMDQRL